VARLELKVTVHLHMRKCASRSQLAKQHTDDTCDAEPARLS
jgi:hypothetical protein